LQRRHRCGCTTANVIFLIIISAHAAGWKFMDVQHHSSLAASLAHHSAWVNYNLALIKISLQDLLKHYAECKLLNPVAASI
jgi:hypothetical protein